MSWPASSQLLPSQLRARARDGQHAPLARGQTASARSPSPGGYAGLDVAPAEVQAARARAGDGVRVEEGLLGGARLVGGAGGEDGLQGLLGGEKVYWDFATGLQEEGGPTSGPDEHVIQLFPGTIRHQPSVYGYDSSADSPGLTLKQAISSAGTVLSSQIDIFEKDTVLALAKDEIRSMYEPETYGVRRRSKRRKVAVVGDTEGETDAEDLRGATRSQAAEPGPSGTQGTDGFFTIPSTQAAEVLLAQQGGRPPRRRQAQLPKHIPRAAQRRADSEYMGNVRRACPLWVPSGSGRAEELPMLAFVMGENGDQLNISSWRRERRQRGNPGPPVFEPTHLPIWSSALPILQLSSASSAGSPAGADNPDRGKLTTLAVRTLSSVHFFSVKRTSSRPASDGLGLRVPGCPGSLVEIDVIRPQNTARRRIVDMQVHPHASDRAVMVDDAGGVWIWTYSVTGRQLQCLHAVPQAAPRNRFFRVVWGLQAQTVLLMSSSQLLRMGTELDSAVELLLDFSGTGTTLVDIEPNSLACGSPYTCLLTNDSVLLIDEGKSGQVVRSVRLSLGPDIFSRLEVCRCSRVWTVRHRSARTTLVETTQIVVDGGSARLVKRYIDRSPYAAAERDEQLALVHCSTAQAMRADHLAVRVTNRGALSAALLASHGPPLANGIDLADWSTEVANLAIPSLAGQPIGPPCQASTPALREHRDLKMEEIAAALLRERQDVSDPPTDLDQAIKDGASRLTRLFHSTLDVLTAADPEWTSAASGSWPASFRSQDPDGIAGSRITVANIRDFLAHQGFCDTLDISATIRAIHGGLEGEQEATQASGTVELGSLRDSLTAASVLTASSMPAKDRQDGSELANAMDVLNVGADAEDHPCVHRLALLHGGQLKRPTSAVQRFVSLPAISALAKEWQLGEDPLAYIWKEQRQASPSPAVRPIASLPPPREVTSHSQPLPPVRFASSALPDSTASWNRDASLADFANTQGLAGPYGSRNVTFSRRKAVKKRTTGF